MISTRLIVIDGIMGTGKSVTSRFLHRQLELNGLPAACYGNPRNGLQQPPDEFRLVLRQLTARQDVWNLLSPEELMRRSLQAWEGFVEHSRNRQEISVFDGRWFNGDFAGLFMMDVPEDRLREHIRCVAEIARPMHMRLAYLCPAEVDPALRWIAARRGPKWIRSQVGWKTASPYGVRRGLSGLEGWISLYRAYTELCVRLLGEIEVCSLHLRASPRRWAANRRELLRALSIPYRIDPRFQWMQLRESVCNWRLFGPRLQGPRS